MFMIPNNSSDSNLSPIDAEFLRDSSNDSSIGNEVDAKVAKLNFKLKLAPLRLSSPISPESATGQSTPSSDRENVDPFAKKFSLKLDLPVQDQERKLSFYEIASPLVPSTKRKNSGSPQEDFKRACKSALRSDSRNSFSPVPAGAGISGAYFILSPSGEILGVFKPTRQQLGYAQMCEGRFIANRSRSGFEPGGEIPREIVAGKFEEYFNVGVPVTTKVTLASSSFQYIDPMPGSVQRFMPSLTKWDTFSDDVRQEELLRLSKDLEFQKAVYDIAFPPLSPMNLRSKLPFALNHKLVIQLFSELKEQDQMKVIQQFVKFTAEEKEELVLSSLRSMGNEDMQRLALFDLYLCNGDRHIENFIVNKQGKPVPIDHGCILPHGFKDPVQFFEKDCGHPGLHVPFTQETLALLNLERDLELVEEYIPDAAEKLQMMHYYVTKGSEIGLTPYQLMSLLEYREGNLFDRSPLQVLDRLEDPLTVEGFCDELEPILVAAKQKFEANMPVAQIRKELCNKRYN